MAAKQQPGVNSGGWTKWQVALAVGTPVALGLGCYWFYRCHGHGSRLKKQVPSADDQVHVLDGQRPAANDDPASPADTKPIEQAQNMKNKGNKLFKGGKYDEAIQCYTEAIDLCPSSKTEDLATFYQNRAAAYEHLKNYAEVVEDCSKALELNRKYTKALNRRAKAYEVTRNLQSCLEDVTSLCILEGFQNQASLFMADRVLKQLGREKAHEAMKNRIPTIPSTHFVKTYFSSFSNDRILNSLGDEGDVDASDKSGFAKVRQDLKRMKYESIVDDCTEELNKESSPFVAEALLLRATFYVFTGQSKLASEDIARILAMENINKELKVNALIKLGSMKVHEEKPFEALEAFAEAEKIDPNNCDVYHHRGQVQLLVEKIEDAISDFQKAVQLNPNFPIAVVQKCYVEFRYAFLQRNFPGIQQAKEQFEAVIKRFPLCVEGHVLFGQVLMDQNEFEKADECFERALKLDADNANVYVHRGLLHLQWKQDLEKAVTLIQEAIRRDDKCEFGYETLGTIEVQRGNTERAFDLFNKAIVLAKTEMELAHLFSLMDAAQAQTQAAKRLGIAIPPTME